MLTYNLMLIRCSKYNKTWVRRQSCGAYQIGHLEPAVSSGRRGDGEPCLQTHWLADIVFTSL